MQIEDVDQVVTEMLESDPTLSYSQALKRAEQLWEFFAWQPEDYLVN